MHDFFLVINTSTWHFTDDKSYLLTINTKINKALNKSLSVRFNQETKSQVTKEVEVKMKNNGLEMGQIVYFMSAFSVKSPLMY